jgi:hypothetical protein
VASEEKDRDDVMDRLLQLGGDKKFLSYDDLNRELPENVVSPDDIEDVLQKLDASNIHVADSDERLIEQAAAISTEEEESDEDLELDLSAGALEKTNDPFIPARNGCGAFADARGRSRHRQAHRARVDEDPQSHRPISDRGDGAVEGRRRTSGPANQHS